MWAISLKAAAKIYSIYKIISVSKYYQKTYFLCCCYFKKMPIGNHRTLEWIYCSMKLRALISLSWATSHGPKSPGGMAFKVKQVCVNKNMFWIFDLLTFIETGELHRKVWCRIDSKQKHGRWLFDMFELLHNRSNGKEMMTTVGEWQWQPC